MRKPALGPSFCAAKWLQTTLDLYHGVSKSCHHTPWTKIDLEQSRKNPLYLTNTPDVLHDRQLMSQGALPLSCHFCWHHEFHAPQDNSDRYLKSSSNWASEQAYHQRLDQQKAGSPKFPSYLEVLFDHRCQMKCLYCSADSSSAIEQELKHYGPYPSSVHFHRSKRLTPSPHFRELQEIFIKWLPELLPALHTLRITGGEPLLSPSLVKLFQAIDDHSSDMGHLTLGINSNLMVTANTWRHFLEQVSDLKKVVKTFQLFTSLDTGGDDAEYIRRGLDYRLFLKRLEEFSSYHSECELIIMVTFCKDSVHSFKSFLEDVALLKKCNPHLTLDLTALMEPEFLSLKNLPAQDITTMIDSLNFMLSQPKLFRPQEILKMRRLIALAKASCGQFDHQALLLQQEQLFKREFDRRL